MDFPFRPSRFHPLPPLCAGQGARPISFMIKPPDALALTLDCRRTQWDIDRRYGGDRLHTTLLPLCDGRDAPAALIDLLGEAVRSLHAEPFAIAFDRVRSNALSGGRNRAVRAFQQRLVRRLAAFGIVAPPYRLRPHLSLTYGDPHPRNFAVEPTGWTVDRILLVRSIYGAGRHELLGAWTLTPRQGELF